jgi:hypothetical protein
MVSSYRINFVIGRMQIFEIRTDSNVAKNISPFVITRIFDCTMSSIQDPKK